MSRTLHTDRTESVVRHSDTNVPMRGRTREQNAAAIRLAEHEHITTIINHSTDEIRFHVHSMDAIREMYNVSQEFDAEMDFWYMSTAVGKAHPVFKLTF